VAGWRRVRAGSGHRYVDDEGEPVDGVTGVISDGVPKPNLTGWAARRVAAYALDHWDELQTKTPSERDTALRGAPWNERDAAAGRGTAIHAYAAQLLNGEQVDVDDALVGHVDACLAFLSDWNVREVAVEAMIVNRQWRYAGTLDLLGYLGDDERLTVVDWKTGASGIWPETALQLAAYAHADEILGPDGTPLELPGPIARGCAVWLRADGYDAYPVDISADTFRSFLYAQQVARFRALPRDATIGDALVPPAAVEVSA
jgi:hypothetical protein